jgi:hypothetical protein
MITLSKWKKLGPEYQKRYLKQFNFRGRLTKGDVKKLCENLEFFEAFLEEAHKVAEKTEKYSARAIIYYLRHQTAIGDNDLDFKVNNNISPMLARASMEMFPRLNAFFETRARL